MEPGNRIHAFYQKADNDHRIHPTHVAIYMALLYQACLFGVNLILPVKELLMNRAKICSLVTYHRTLKELHEYGYIIYRPSFVSGRTRIEVVVL